jgi:tetratricopeptide (TPR) repeat protein
VTAGASGRAGRYAGGVMAAFVLAVLAACGSGTSGPTKTSAEVLLNERMASVLLHEGRFADAETAYRDVLHSDPKNPELHDGLGVCLMMQGKFRDSLDPFDRAIRLSPELGRYRVHRGMARTQLGRYGEAEEDFKVADTSSNPDDRFDAQVNRGRLRQRQGDYPGAEHEFSGALSHDPKSFDALLGRGSTREAMGNVSGAAEDYLEAVKLQPKSAEANLRLGLALLTLKKTALGRRYLERTVELDPGGDNGARARLLLESNPSS